MKYCYKCGTQLEDDDLFCIKCGTRQSNEEISQEDGNGSPNTRTNSERHSGSTVKTKETDEMATEKNNTGSFRWQWLLIAAVALIAGIGFFLMKGTSGKFEGGSWINSFYAYTFNSDGTYEKYLASSVIGNVPTRGTYKTSGKDIVLTNQRGSESVFKYEFSGNDSLVLYEKFDNGEYDTEGEEFTRVDDWEYQVGRGIVARPTEVETKIVDETQTVMQTQNQPQATMDIKEAEKENQSVAETTAVNNSKLNFIEAYKQVLNDANEGKLGQEDWEKLKFYSLLKVKEFDDPLLIFGIVGGADQWCRVYAYSNGKASQLPMQMEGCWFGTDVKGNLYNELYGGGLTITKMNWNGKGYDLGDIVAEGYGDNTPNASDYGITEMNVIDVTDGKIDFSPLESENWEVKDSQTQGAETYTYVVTYQNGQFVAYDEELWQLKNVQEVGDSLSFTVYYGWDGEENFVTNHSYGENTQKLKSGIEASAKVYAFKDSLGNAIYLDYFKDKGMIRLTDDAGTERYYSTDAKKESNLSLIGYSARGQAKQRLQRIEEFCENELIEVYSYEYSSDGELYKVTVTSTESDGAELYEAVEFKNGVIQSYSSNYLTLLAIDAQNNTVTYETEDGTNLVKYREDGNIDSVEGNYSYDNSNIVSTYEYNSSGYLVGIHTKNSTSGSEFNFSYEYEDDDTTGNPRYRYEYCDGAFTGFGAELFFE